MLADFGRDELAELRPQRDRLHQTLIETQSLISSGIPGHRLQRSLENAEAALQNELQVINDHLFVLSTAIADFEDALLVESFSAEDQAARDFEIAGRLGYEPETEHDTTPPAAPSALADSYVQNYRSQIFGPQEGDEKAAVEDGSEDTNDLDKVKPGEHDFEEADATDDEEDDTNQTPNNTSPVRGRKKRDRSPSESDDEQQPPAKKQILDPESYQHNPVAAPRGTESSEERHQPPRGSSVVDELLLIGVVGNEQPEASGVQVRDTNRNNDAAASDLPSDPTQADHDLGLVCSGCETPRLGSDCVLDCSHWFCGICLSHIFRIATGAGHPARCCKTDINLAQVRQNLEAGVAARHEQRLHELSFKRPVYCKGSCESEILGEQMEEKANLMCKKCSTTTCMHCRALSHDGLCETDRPDEAFKALAAKESWHACPGCHQFIELETGCYHMTCVCKTEFCFKCGKVWGTCKCPLFDEILLHDRAAREAVRMEMQAEAGNQPLDQTHRIELFNRILTRHRQVVENCTHVGLSRIEIHGICDTCVYFGPKYLMRNCGCGLEVCKWCSHFVLDDEATATLPRGLRRQFFARPSIRRLETAVRERRWAEQVRNIYRWRMARLEASARQEAPRAVLGNMGLAHAALVQREQRDRQNRQRDLLRAVGADVEAWERRFVPS